MRYEVPSEATCHLRIGTWVEIMESYDHRNESDSIQVKTMRVDSRTLAFPSNCSDEARPLRPHEGLITCIENCPTKTLFSIRLR